MSATVEELFGCIATQFGIATGEAIQTAINELIAMPNVDVSALTAAVAQIQALLDADEGTEGFQLGQNIVTALTNLTSRVTSLENSDVVAQLQSMVNSLGTDLANETNRAQAAEANLQDQIDALTSDLAALEAVVAALPTSSCDCAALQAQITANGTAITNLQATDAAIAIQIAAIQASIDSLSAQVTAASAAAAAATNAAAAAATVAGAAQAAVDTLSDTVADLDAREAAATATTGTRLTALEGFKAEVLAVDCSALRTLFTNGIDMGRLGGY